MLFFGSEFLLTTRFSVTLLTLSYVSTVAAGYICLLTAGVWLTRLLKNQLMDDVFNDENESFMQETRLIANEYSVNLPTRFYYKKKWHNGWINVVSPQRGCIVVGCPGSGKSYCVINQFIKQQIEKGYALYCYDFKFPDLSLIAYNQLLKNKDKYAKPVGFYVINFDDPRHSHRCNPLNPAFLSDIADAYESAYVIMLNLNKSWIQKQGDFFVESPIVLFAAVIWYLKIFENGHYCTFPHAIELLNKPYSDLFTILTSYRELENYLSPFMDAWKGGAMEQLQGQIASAKIPLSRLISPALYWIMTGDDFTLDINNPDAPKVLCVGNNPDRQNIYSAALGLYNARIVKMVNRKGKLKCSILVDEVPTIYFKGLDTLIATARSNKVAVMLGAQDYSQLVRDYGDKEARVIQNTIGNIFAGQVVGETAKNLSERFGKVLQQRKSINMTREDTSTNISTQLDSLIPASKISNLSQGEFVGSVCDSSMKR
ncbi:mobilization protein BF0133 [Bacteroides reticulotermitis JCM 10512]|uniref:Mobilization protein BF0133 n=1 Tax=Bacteroides reticulotermitis JCM 10512 TaxID=1445607 RepID=W4UL58_9BACE|nr:mobilization protein BF0133 [Bacteroides reticulotermitis JCM 10512]